MYLGGCMSWWVWIACVVDVSVCVCVCVCVCMCAMICWAGTFMRENTL